MARVVWVFDDISFCLDAARPVDPFDGEEVNTCVGQVMSTTFCSLLSSWMFKLLNQTVVQPASMLSYIQLYTFGRVVGDMPNLNFLFMRDTPVSVFLYKPF